MSKENNLTDFLTGVANAIRTKKGTTGAINPQNFESEIENISSGKPETAPTVTLNLAPGNQVVTPSEGQVFSQVTITKPSTLLASNIKKDVNIAGVVGTFEGGGFTPTNYSGTLTFTREIPNCLFFLRVDNNGNIEPDYTSYIIYQPSSTVQFTNVSAVFMDCSNFGGIVDVQESSDCSILLTGERLVMFRITGSAPEVKLRDD